MAYDFEFSGGVTLDANGNPVPGATGQVYQNETGGDPLTVLVGGVETTTIQTGSGVAVIQSFFADYEIVYADFGAGRFRVNSWDGIRSYVSAVAESAQDASNSAAEALTRSFRSVGEGILRGPSRTIYATKSAAEADLLANNAQIGDLVLVEDPTA